KITMVCDRGYISEKNLVNMKENGISYLMLLKSNLNDYNFILNNYYEKLKNNYSNYIEDLDYYGLTVERKIFGRGDINYFHLIYDRRLEDKHTKNLHELIRNRKKFILSSINRKKSFYKDEIEHLSQWHDIETEDAGTIIVNKRGRGGSEQVVPAYHIISFSENIQKIKNSLDKCGFYVLVSSNPITAKEAKIAYSKRDCVEKVFQVLKSTLGMNKIGIYSENNLHGKSLIWFISSIIHSIIFKKLEVLRANDRKSFTFQAVMNKLGAIKADKDLNLNIYKRRYCLDSKQKKIIDLFAISEKVIDDSIQSLS
nr:transposase [Desulfovibrio sp.]